MTTPNFFIIGAPKCGTTSLAFWLSKHPGIYMSPIKEPHYYNTDMKNRVVSSQEEYAKLFRRASADHRRVGEASVWYLYSREAVPNILADNPDARFIVCLRNPVDMALSLYRQHLNALTEHITPFEFAWKAQQDRENGRNVNDYCMDPSVLLYGPACRLGAQLEALFRVAPAANVKTVFLEDLSSDPRGVYLDILRFLDLADDGQSDFSVKNPASAMRSVTFRKFIWQAARWKRRLGVPMLHTGFMEWLVSLNKRRMERNVAEPEFIQREVRPYFAAEVRLMEQLTGRSLAHWRA